MSKSMRKLLNEAMVERIPVTITRAGLGRKADKIDCYVVEVGADWVVLASRSQVVYLDGWEVVRVKDVTAVTVETGDLRSYIQRALVNLGAPVVHPEGFRVSDDRTAKETLLEMLASRYLVGFHLEEEDPQMRFIGEFTGYNKKWFGFRQVGSSGKWDVGDSLFRKSKVTRVTIGGRYQDALEMFGDPAPEPLE